VRSWRWTTLAAPLSSTYRTAVTNLQIPILYYVFDLLYIDGYDP
jgi:ATP-dependent DNA ligase